MVEPFGVAKVDKKDRITFDVQVPMLLRVVRAEVDMVPLLSREVLDAHGGVASGVDLFKIIAPYLHEGLVDPGNGMPNPRLVHPFLIEHDDGVCGFAQVVTTMN